MASRFSSCRQINTNPTRMEDIELYWLQEMQKTEGRLLPVMFSTRNDITDGTLDSTLRRLNGFVIKEIRMDLKARAPNRMSFTGLIYLSVLMVLLIPIVSAASKPNIVVIITDDQGYADISFNPHHGNEVSTPHMDSLAREGVWFSNAYISGNVCSPTRLGLMTGRYQQRYGVYTAGEGGTGIDPAIPIFPAFFKPAGYVSGAFGKWHLGIRPDHNPIPRGFDTFYGFMGRGAHDYFKLRRSDDGFGGKPGEHPLYRGRNPIDDTGYLTNRITDEAVSFIKRSKRQPFFAYIAYNAVHSPPQAPQEDVDRYKKAFPEISEDRAVLMAMLYHLDEGVGNVIKTLKQEGEWENTLLFFLTDNGGAPNMEADCSPLRGHKHENYEGGIRTPWVVSWPAKFEGERSIDTPVTSLDILPTVVEAVGLDASGGSPFDGKSLFPVLEGETAVLHDNLYWSESGGNGHWAVRTSDHWKLVTTVDKKAGVQKHELFHLGRDPSESNDLSGQYPQKVKELIVLYDAWLDEMAEPMSGENKRWRAN
jgi:arylsulfatase A-like enzyme